MDNLQVKSSRISTRPFAEMHDEDDGDGDDVWHHDHGVRDDEG